MGTETTGRVAILGVDPSFNRTGWCLLDADAGGVRLAAAGIIAPKGDGRPEQLHAWEDLASPEDALRRGEDHGPRNSLALLNR